MLAVRRPALLWLAGAGAAVGVVVVLSPPVAAVLIPALLCLFALRALARRGTAGWAADRRWLTALTVAVFAGHLAIGLALNTSPALVFRLAPDALGYHAMAGQLAAFWHGTGPDPGLQLGIGKEGFLYGLAGLYWLVGPYSAAGLVVNCAFAAALLPVSYDTTRRLFGPPAARATAVMLAVLPGFVFWGSLLLREAPILFCLAAMGNVLVRLADRVTPAAVMMLGACAVVLFSLRSNVALTVLCGALLGLALGLRRMSTGVVIGVAAIVVVGGLTMVAGVGQGGLFAALGANLQEVTYYRRALAAGVGSGFYADADVSTPAAALRFLPSAAAAFLFGPYPWQVKTAFQSIGLVDAATMWLLAPALYRGIRCAVREKGRRVLLLASPAAALLVTLCLLISNYGMVLRERPQVLMFLLPIVGHGWTVGRRPREQVSDPLGPEPGPDVAEMERAAA